MNLGRTGYHSLNELKVYARMELEDLFYTHHDIYRTLSYFEDVFYNQLVTNINSAIMYYEQKKEIRMESRNLFGETVKAVNLILDKQEHRMSIEVGINAIHGELRYLIKNGVAMINNGRFSKEEANRHYSRLSHVSMHLKKLKKEGITHI